MTVGTIGYWSLQTGNPAASCIRNRLDASCHACDKDARMYNRLLRVLVTATFRLGLAYWRLFESYFHMRSSPPYPRPPRRLRPCACQITIFSRDAAKIPSRICPGFVRAIHPQKTSLALASTLVTCALPLIHLSFVSSWQWALKTGTTLRADRKMMRSRFPCVLLSSGQFRAYR